MVQAAIEVILQGLRTTAILIAHRLSTIKHATKIAAVSRGTVVEEGTYEELLAKGEGGVFYALAARQEQQARQDQASLHVRGAEAEHASSSGGDHTALGPASSDEGGHVDDRSTARAA